MKTMFEDLMSKYPKLPIKNNRPERMICPADLGYEEPTFEHCGLLYSECWGRPMEENA